MFLEGDDKNHVHLTDYSANFETFQRLVGNIYLCFSNDL